MRNFFPEIRSVIIPGASDIKTSIEKPAVFYKTTYILFAWIVTSLVLTRYSSLLSVFIGPENFGREFLICGGQIVFQFFILLSFKKNKTEIFEYVGNMMTISLAGALLLLPGIAIGKIFATVSPLIFVLYFMFVAGLMFLEHIRRMKITGLPKVMSLTWVIYRVLVLLLILSIKN